MSKKANPTAVGLFVIIGSVLLVAGFITFGNFEWKGESEIYLLYFDSSVKGLSVGAPVTHRGVTIGAVTDVRLRFNQAQDDKFVPVFIELKNKLIKAQIDDGVDIDQQLVMKDLIAGGLRGQLEASSMITGQLYINLAFVENAPPPVQHQLDPVYPEVPTVPSGIQAMLEKMSKININEIADRLTSILEQLDQAVEDLDMKGISNGLTEVMASINVVLNDPSLHMAISNASNTLEDFKETSKTLRTEIVDVSDDLGNSLDQIQLTVVELREGVADLRHTLSADNVLAANLSTALEKLAEASSSVSELADFILLNPNALISGRAAEESK
jgi:paraquat-inducible protein B